MYFHRLIVALGLCALVAGAYAATTVGSLEPTAGTWRAYRGTGFTTLVCSANSEAAVLACAAADAERRSATTRYQIRYPNRYATVTYSAPPPPTAEWTFCSLEWAYCKFEGTRRVRFGLGNSWVERDLTAPAAGIECWRGTFGSDPVPGMAKRCELRVETTPPSTTEPQPTGTATLSWIAPTQNEDGTALTNLAGYRIHYGRSPTELTATIQVPASVTRYIVEDLAPGDWFFAVRAYTSTSESEPSNTGSKVVF